MKLNINILQYFQYYIFILLTVAFIFDSSDALSEKRSLKIETIVIDPGHGGKDPGAIVNGIKEKDIALAISKKLGKYIKANIPNINVIYTRQTDVFIPLVERANIANKAKANAFISVHVNVCGTPSVYGTETYTLGLHRSQDNLDVAKKENSVILLEQNHEKTYQKFDPNSPESYIIFELMQNEYLDQSIDLASLIQQQFKTRAGRRDRGVKQAGFLVLRETSMPSVLVEVGYMSNQSERNFLNSDQGQSYIASAIYRAFKEYKNKIDQRYEPSKTTTIKNKTSNTPNGNEEIVFCTQIKASVTKIPTDSPIFKHTKVIEMKIGNWYKYYSGENNSYEKAILQFHNIKKIFPDAFLISLKNGIPISISEARKLTN